MKVLMFGWEFPPYNSGGLGTACYGLTKELCKNNIEIKFVIPRSYPNMKSKYVKLISQYKITNKKFSIQKFEVNSLIKGYLTSNEYTKYYEESNKKIKINYKGSNNIYGKNLFEEVKRFANNASLIAKEEEHDIIHCHDWMTYDAGIIAKNISKKPLVVHIHATEFDRTAQNPNPYIYEIEKRGFENADEIIAVSNYTKNKLIDKYYINPEKIKVVHNGVNIKKNISTKRYKSPICKSDKIILFLGRITIQKGPDWFLYAAKKALSIDSNLKFIFAGSGDMQNFIIEKAAELGIADKILFTGFLRGKDIDKAYQSADLYVMPSISEPFGITPLEAMSNNTPVLISKQSGVSETIRHCLKVDFWDTDAMASKMISVIKHKELQEELQNNGFMEVKNMTWSLPAKKCHDIYKEIINKKNNTINGGCI